MKIGLESVIAISGFGPAELAVLLEDHGFESFWLGEHSHMDLGIDRVVLTDDLREMPTRDERFQLVERYAPVIAELASD
ncbi:MAG TPA: hypothetical protein VHB02_14825 [Acidimicrobiales bacterium]|nr:hypothetical protein [Acidimicrobiales bacterium]